MPVIGIKKRLSVLFAWLHSIDRNERVYWLGMSMLFVGLTWSTSVFIALIVVGASMALEGAVTSYLAGLINSRNGSNQ